MWTETESGGLTTLAYGPLDPKATPLLALSCFSGMNIAVLDVHKQIPGAKRGDPITIELSSTKAQAPVKAEVEINEATGTTFGEASDIDVKPVPTTDTPAIPVARRVVTTPTRVDGIDLPLPHEAWLIPARLLRLPNLLVMGIVLFAHFVGALMLLAIVTFYWILIPFWIVLNGLILSHFANVVDETGPTSSTDLPAPLRNLDWHDDTFGPFVRM